MRYRFAMIYNGALPLTNPKAKKRINTEISSSYVPFINASAEKYFRIQKDFSVFCSIFQGKFPSGFP